MLDFALADQDRIRLMIFKNFADQDWTRIEKFHSPLISGLQPGWGAKRAIKASHEISMHHFRFSKKCYVDLCFMRKPPEQTIDYL